MKKLLIINTLLLISLFSNNILAQRIALEACYSNPAQRGTDVSTTYLNGNQLGATINFDFKHNIGLSTGLSYMVAFGANNQVFSLAQHTDKYTLGLYTDIPLRISYSLPVSKSFKFFAFGGPNLNIGFIQKQVITSTYSAVKAADHDLYTDKAMNNFNFQLGAGGGIQWEKAVLKGGYNFGLNNLNNDTKGVKIYQSNWYVTLALDVFSFKKEEKVSSTIKPAK